MLQQHIKPPEHARDAMTMIAGDYTVALLDESDARISSVKNVFVDES